MTSIGLKITVDNTKVCTGVTKSFSEDWVSEIWKPNSPSTIKEKKCSYIENNPQRDSQAYKMNGFYSDQFFVEPTWILVKIHNHWAQLFVPKLLIINN